MIDPALVERFDEPPAEYGPTPLWWWSGGTVTEEGIDWQLRTFVDGGVRNVVLMNLAPKGPTYGAPPDDPVWFSERWWELFRYTCDRAAALGVRLWFYDQIGFSGANLQGTITAVHPGTTGRSLRSHLVDVAPDGTVPVGPREHLVAVYDVEPTGPGRWHRHVVHDGRVEAAGAHVRVVTYADTSFDYLDRDAVALLMDTVHGEYERRVPEHVGTTIVGSFQDELPPMPTWSATFPDRFRDETGYDLVAVLPALWDHDAPGGDRVRDDYHRVRTMLAEQAFFRPLGEWHRDRGMLLGADQMNPGRAGVPTQSTQLYGDYPTTHRWFDAVGSDHEGDARIHSSIADLYDHPRVWIESFHSSGWGGTLEDTWDWLIPFFRSGANLYNPHASYYGLRAGWFEWAPPSTDFRQPYWEVYPEFSRAVARVSALMTWGRHAVEVGLLYPSTSIRSELPPDLPIDHFASGDVGPEHPGVDETQHAYMALAGKNDWFRAQPGLLDRAGIDFDVLDEDSVTRSTIGSPDDREDGAALAVGAFRFHTVVLPSVRALPETVTQRLLDLLDAGGRVIAVGAVAPGIDGHPLVERAATPEDAVVALAGTAQFARGSYGVRAQRQGDTGVALVPGAFPNATAYPLRQDEHPGGWADIDVDPGRYAAADELRVRGRVVEAEVWDPATGRRTPAPCSVEPDGSASTIRVVTGGAPLVLAVWRTARSTSAEPDTSTESAVSAVGATGPSGTRGAADATTGLQAEWTQELVPTLDNRWGDFALPAGTDQIPLELWRIDQVTRDGRVPVRVTVGQELLVDRPTADAPAPLDAAAASRVLSGDGDLGDDSRWTVQRWSATTGRDGALGAPQDPKGFVAEEFVTHETPAPGETVGVRAVVRLPAAGTYDLTIASASPTRAWFDGVGLALTGDGYEATAQVTTDGRTGVLEYRLDAPDLPLGSEVAPRHVTSSFRFDRPGVRTPVPEFVAAGPDGVVDGTAVFRRRFRLDTPAAHARVVTGSSTALTVLVDGQPVARQEQVEYYASGLGDLPDHFLHELPALDAGEHVVEIVTEGTTARTGLFVDLVCSTAAGVVAVPSGAGWTVGPRDAPAVPVPARSGATVHARAAVRPHPLPAAHWLSGAPEVGELTVPVETAVSLAPRTEAFVITVPAGTRTLELGVEPAQVTVEGSVVTVDGTTATIDPPTSAAPSEVVVTLAPRTFSTSGAAWPGPVRVQTVPVVSRFGDWAEQGLDQWSGAVRYRTGIDLDADDRLRLDLGRVRGAVVVSVDGATVARAFCAPFVFDLDPGAGHHEVAVTVYGTLAPRYAAATQTTFLSPSQLHTGITGPVRLERRPAPGGTR